MLRFEGRAARSTVARVSAEEHMANYRAAEALLGKGNSERVREWGSSAKKSAVKKAKPKGVLPKKTQFRNRTQAQSG